MTEMIYFDSKKNVYGAQYKEITVVASTDIDTWGMYAADPPGTTWDIVNGSFVKLKPVEQIRRERKSAERSYERAMKYDEADRMISKHYDFVALGMDPDGTHAAMVNAWRTYKVNVRGTPEQINYPDSVVYPNRPEA